MSVSIRNRSSGRDPVARAHRRSTALKSAVGVVVCSVVLVGGVWLMFASTFFSVTLVNVEGAAASVNEQVRQSAEAVLGQKRLGLLRPARNMLLLDNEAVALSLRSAFGNIASVTVTKEFPHTVRVRVAERNAIGSWCTGETCQYFDITGARWGAAVPSRGPLLLLVHDEREVPVWDQRLFNGLLAASRGLTEQGMRAVEAVLPNSAPGDLRIRVASGPEVLFDALGDVTDQLGTLGVLVADRSSDAAFQPQYIDVRTPGRAYYR